MNQSLKIFYIDIHFPINNKRCLHFIICNKKFPTDIIFIANNCKPKRISPCRTAVCQFSCILEVCMFNTDDTAILNIYIKLTITILSR